MAFDPNFRCPALLRLARDQRCQHCQTRDATIVSAHSNQSLHGKGGHLKAHDCYIAWLCARCHAWLDQGRGMDPLGIFGPERADRVEAFNRSMHATWLEWWRGGLIRVA